MRVQVKVPTETVDIFMTGMDRDDIQALIHVLDADRNHPARSQLYSKLRDAKELLDKEAYKF